MRTATNQSVTSTREQAIRNAAVDIRRQLPTITSTPDQRIEFLGALGESMGDLEGRFVNFDRTEFLEQVGR